MDMSLMQINILLTSDDDLKDEFECDSEGGMLAYVAKVKTHRENVIGDIVARKLDSLCH